MGAKERREAIITQLKNNKQQITGSDLATMLSVSRQVIVQDIAILRAKGHRIIATPQGYMLLAEDTGRSLKRTFACCHKKNNTEKELNIFVDCGGIVEDVIVEHPIYGQISGTLMLKSRTDVSAFCRKIFEGEATLLSSLTGGVHLHTIKAEKEEVFDFIEKKLRDADILLDQGLD